MSASNREPSIRSFRDLLVSSWTEDKFAFVIYVIFFLGPVVTFAGSLAWSWVGYVAILWLLGVVWICATAVYIALGDNEEQVNRKSGVSWLQVGFVAIILIAMLYAIK